eukprot:TRINITY_DN2848_c1_g1_i2.p3 TRINITY_DN2848_c1_g1~~TRINITY_DN2848_c1_g1_i2.p3  ORF type:complete len:114 (+),score=5.99 TRINITY_DN2848_c1_g1_i2:81-422(+)
MRPNTSLGKEPTCSVTCSLDCVASRRGHVALRRVASIASRPRRVYFSVQHRVEHHSSRKVLTSCPASASRAAAGAAQANADASMKHADSLQAQLHAMNKREHANSRTSSGQAF